MKNRLNKILVIAILVAVTAWQGSAIPALASPQEFIDRMGPLAQQIVTPSCGFPSVTIAQGAQESGWGTSYLYAEANNPFGRKCGQRPCVLILTPEEKNGVRVMEPHWFQVYDSLEDALTDYCDKIAKPWYRRDFTSPQSFVDSIARTYASDSGYAIAIKRIIREWDLEKFDRRE